MSKKTAFLVERNLYYKFFSPFIDELLKNNVEVHLIHYASSSILSSGSSKLFYYPQISQIPQFSKKIENVHKVETFERLQECLTQYNFDLIFSLHPKGYFPTLQTSTKWVTLQHGVDSAEYKDQTSDYYIVYTKKWFENFKTIPKTQVLEAGLYHAEPNQTDRKSILKRYNLSPDKKYVLFVPLPAADHQSYIFWPYKGLNSLVLKYLVRREIKILKELKKTLDETNTQILIKSRFKRFLPQEYHDCGLVFYDDMFYPPTINDLTSISEHVYINYMPGAVLTEIAAFQKPYTFIHYPILDKPTFGFVKGFMREAFLPQESLPHWVNHKNISELQNYKLRSKTLSPEYIDNFITPKNKLSLNEVIKRIL